MTIEKLVQKYEQPGANNIQVPPEAVIIMLKDGSFWTGEGGSGPLTDPPAPVSLSSGVAATLLVASTTRRGARLLNFSSAPVYLSTTNPPPDGPPSEFVPPGQQDDDGNVWPGQFTFDYSPTDEWYALCSEDAQLSLFVW